MALSIHIEQQSFLKRSIWLIDGTLPDTTTLGQNGSGSNGNEGALQNWSLTIRCSLGSYCKDTEWRGYKKFSTSQLIKKWKYFWYTPIIEKVYLFKFHFKCVFFKEEMQIIIPETLQYNYMCFLF